MAHLVPELNSISTLKSWPPEVNTFLQLSWIDRPGSASQRILQTSTVENETSDLNNSQVGSHSK